MHEQLLDLTTDERTDNDVVGRHDAREDQITTSVRNYPGNAYDDDEADGGGRGQTLTRRCVCAGIHSGLRRGHDSATPVSPESHPGTPGRQKRSSAV